MLYLLCLPFNVLFDGFGVSAMGVSSKDFEKCKGTEIR